MSSIFIRTIIMYVVISVSMHLMGKRQVGELQLSELVTALLLSELASYPIADTNIPLAFGILPIIVLLTSEVLISYAATKSTFLKRIIDNTPCILVKNGILDQVKLRKVRFTLDELLSELRQSGYPDITSVDYVVLEPNGKISVIPKAAKAPASAQDLNLSPVDNGLAHAVIIDGYFNYDYIEASGKDIKWINQTAHEMGYYKMDEIFLMTVNDVGTVNIIAKSKN